MASITHGLLTMLIKETRASLSPTNHLNGSLLFFDFTRLEFTNAKCSWRDSTDSKLERLAHEVGCEIGFGPYNIWSAPGCQSFWHPVIKKVEKRLEVGSWLFCQEVAG